jgi:hypothetical protein
MSLKKSRKEKDLADRNQHAIQRRGLSDAHWYYDNGFIKFCFNNNFFVRTPLTVSVSLSSPSAPLPYTHLLTCGTRGGKINIPKHAQGEAMRLYAHDICQGRIHYVTEMRTSIFRLFSDIDMDCIENLPMRRVHEILFANFDVVCSFYENLPDAAKKRLVCVVTRAPIDKRTLKEEMNGIPIGTPVHKIGIRLYYGFLAAENKAEPGSRAADEEEDDTEIVQGLYVSQQQARTMNAAIISHLSYKLGTNYGYASTWEKIFDDCVFTNNGTRLLGSSKTKRCEACRDSKHDSEVHDGSKQDDPTTPSYCAKCDDLGKVNIGRIYKVWQVLPVFPPPCAASAPSCVPAPSAPAPSSLPANSSSVPLRSPLRALTVKLTKNFPAALQATIIRCFLEQPTPGWAVPKNDLGIVLLPDLTQQQSKTADAKSSSSSSAPSGVPSSKKRKERSGESTEATATQARKKAKTALPLSAASVPIPKLLEMHLQDLSDPDEQRDQKNQTATADAQTRIPSLATKQPLKNIVILQQVEDLIRASHIIYKEICVDRNKCYATQSNRHFYINVKGKGSNYCLNKKGIHNSVNIYFFIQKDGLYQRCYCRCQTREREFGQTCKQFKHFIAPLPQKLYALLFSDEATGSCMQQSAINILPKRNITLYRYQPVSFDVTSNDTGW